MLCSEILNVNFSPSGTTAECCQEIVKAMQLPEIELPLLSEPLEAERMVPSSTLLLVGMPVYGGRLIPEYVEMLRRLQVKGCAAIAVVVYGNRDYDDALLELVDVLREMGAHVLAAGAFIGRHSLFRRVAEGRPDSQDKARLAEFGHQSKVLLDAWQGGAVELSVKGKRPYMPLMSGGLPVQTLCSEECISCGVCADACPKEAISSDNLRATDMNKCMCCGACITVCPVGARTFGGPGFEEMAAGFAKSFSAYREPEVFYASLA